VKYQWQIMKSLGFEDDEQIRSFEDPLTWLSYFPPLAVNDLKSIGIHVSIYILFALDSRYLHKKTILLILP